MHELTAPKKIIITIAGIALLLFLWFYIASTVLLAAFDLDPNAATPLTIWQYYQAYQANAVVMKWIYISAAASTAILGVPVILTLLPEKRLLHGKAKFATRLDIKKSGLLGNSGVIVGNYKGTYLMFGGTQHVILSAPTRSGKGVGIVIPNLLNWNESVVVLDIKQENWSLTSKYRSKHGQTCYLFNPLALDGRTHRYNPLGYISHNPHFRVDDVQKIATMLFSNNNGDQAFWESQARMLFVGIVLFLIESKNIDENRNDTVTNFGEVLDLSLKGGDPNEFFMEALEDEKYKALSTACRQGLLNYASNDSEKTRSSIMATFRAKFELWTNPIVQAATATNDFDLRCIRKQKVSIYIGVSPNNLDRIAPLLNLFFQQLIDLNTGEGDLPSQNKEIKYNCLLLMDEFTAIGKMPILSKGIGYIAGYGLRMMPIIQSPSQLVEVYGKDAAVTFQSNHALSIIYPPKATEIETAEAISKWLGDETVKSVSKSRSAGLSFSNNNGGSNSTSDQRRALLLPQEIIALGGKSELVILENTPPIKASKIIYYNDPVFTDRFKKVSPFLAKLKNKIPTKAELDKAVQDGELSADVPKLTQTAEQPNETETLETKKVTGVAIKMTEPIENNQAVKLFDMPKKHII